METRMSLNSYLKKNQINLFEFAREIYDSGYKIDGVVFGLEPYLDFIESKKDKCQIIIEESENTKNISIFFAE